MEGIRIRSETRRKVQKNKERVNMKIAEAGGTVKEIGENCKIRL